MIENINSLVAIIGGGSVGAAILIAFTKKLIKSNLVERFGDLGVQVVLLLISLVIATAVFSWQFVPEGIAIITLGILTGANAIYQVLWKAIIRKAILGKLDKDEKPLEVPPTQ